MSKTSQMRAAYGLGSYRFELRDVPVPKPTEGQALIRVKACAICGSDKHEQGQSKVADRISGHEISGIVEEIAGPEAGLQPGEQVAVAPLWYCGECKYCALGRTSLCLKPSGVIGYGKSGGFAEYMVAPTRTLCTKPETISFHEAALTEPLAVAVRGVSLVDVSGHDCIVFGAGAIGLMLAQVLEVRGANQIYIVDIDEQHLALARELGQFSTIQANDTDQWEQLEKGDVRVGFDAVGRAPSVTQKAVEVVNRGGSCVLIGTQDPDVLKATGFERKNVSLLFSVGVHMSEMTEANRLMEEGKVDVKPLFSGVFSLDQIEEAFEAARKGIKVILEP